MGVRDGGDVFALEGADEIARAFKTLGAKTAKKVVRPALRAGLKPIAVKAAELAPVKTGATRASIRVGPVKAKRRGSIFLAVLVGKFTKAKGEKFPKKKGRGSSDPFWALFQEFGWTPRSRTKGRKKYTRKRLDSRGAMVVVHDDAPRKIDHTEISGRRFLGRAFEANKELAKRLIQSHVAKGIEAEASKSKG